MNSGSMTNEQWFEAEYAHRRKDTALYVMLAVIFSRQGCHRNRTRLQHYDVMNQQLTRA